MTELERELQATVKMQQEIFTQELRSVTEQYERSLNEITDDYRTQIERSNSYLEGQNKVISSLLELLKNYESELADVEISFDQQSLGSLNSQLSKLHSRLDALEKQDRNLVEQLNGVLREL